MNSADVMYIHLDENAWIVLQKASMSPVEALWKEDDSPFSLTNP